VEVAMIEPEHKLAPNFTFGELTTTSHTGLIPSLRAEAGKEPVLGRLRMLAALLQGVRGLIGAPMRVTSGYRSVALNRAIGGSSRRSQHMTGSAADFVCPAGPQLDEVFAVIVQAMRDGSLPYPVGQVINERSGGAHWIHISLANREGDPGGQVMTFDGRRYRLVERIQQPHPALQPVPIMRDDD
jgi:zinc D-Ala-D-Ala carboxypeptidase